MSRAQKHRIVWHSFEVIVPPTLAQPDWGQAIADLQRDTLLPLIEQICNTLCPTDFLCRIEHLELDLGTLPMQALAQELPERFASMLHAALSQQIASALAANDARNASNIAPGAALDGRFDAPLDAAIRPLALASAESYSGSSSLALFDWFLRHGTLAWWATSSATLLQENLQYLLQQQPAALRSRLVACMTEPLAVSRLIKQYDDIELAQLMALLAPHGDTAIAQLAPLFCRLLQAGMLARSGQISASRTTVWSAALRLALQNSTPTCEAADFAANMLKQLPTAYPVSASDIGHELHAALPCLPTALRADAVAMLARIPAPSSAVQQDWLHACLSRLAQTASVPMQAAWLSLQSAQPHWPAHARQRLQQRLRPFHARLKQAAIALEQEYLALAVLPVVKEFASAALAQQFAQASAMINSDKVDSKPNALGRYLARMVSRGGLLSDFFTHLLMRSNRLSGAAQKSWLTLISAHTVNSAALLSAIQALLQSEAHGLEPHDLQALRGCLPTTSAGFSAGMTAHASNNSVTSAIALENAGLVILWPFFKQLFERLGLLDGADLRHLAARQRAVGVLQVFANPLGHPVLAEYALPLNKLLCGMDLAEPFEFGRALSQRERRECQNLLGAILAQAPVLSNLSLAGFAGSFIVRDGQLLPQDEPPRLVVSGQTWDIVLSRLPWSWEWVKLPWMAQPLRVEWGE